MADGPALKLVHESLVWTHCLVEPAVCFSYHGLRVSDVGKSADTNDGLSE